MVYLLAWAAEPVWPLACNRVRNIRLPLATRSVRTSHIHKSVEEVQLSKVTVCSGPLLGVSAPERRLLGDSSFDPAVRDRRAAPQLGKMSARTRSGAAPRHPPSPRPNPHHRRSRNDEPILRTDRIRGGHPWRVDAVHPRVRVLHIDQSPRERTRNDPVHSTAHPQARTILRSFHRPRATRRKMSQRPGAVVPFLDQLLSQLGIVHFLRNFPPAENHLRIR